MPRSDAASSIRPRAICLFRRADRILVSFAIDPRTGGRYARTIGGAIEFGERSEDAVRREVREELGVGLASLEFDHTIHASAALEGVPMAMDVFRGELVGAPSAAAEIAAIAWHRPGEPLPGRLAPAIEALYASAPVWMRS